LADAEIARLGFRFGCIAGTRCPVAFRFDVVDVGFVEYFAARRRRDRYLAWTLSFEAKIDHVPVSVALGGVCRLRSRVSLLAWCAFV
jgi:hypothetical protein